MQWFLVVGLPVLIVIVAGFLKVDAVLSTVGFLYDGIYTSAYYNL